VVETADTDYKKPFITDRNFLRWPFFSRRPQTTVFSFSACNFQHFYDFFSLPHRKVHLFPQNKKIFYDDTQYRRCWLFLPIPITTNCSNNRPGYAQWLMYRHSSTSNIPMRSQPFSSRAGTHATDAAHILKYLLNIVLYEDNVLVNINHPKNDGSKSVLLIHKPTCYRNCWALFQTPVQHTSGSCSPSWKYLRKLGQTALRCNPLDRKNATV